MRSSWCQTDFLPAGIANDLAGAKRAAPLVARAGLNTGDDLRLRPYWTPHRANQHQHPKKCIAGRVAIRRTPLSRQRPLTSLGSGMAADLDSDIVGRVVGSLTAVIVVACDDETFIIWEPS